MSHVDEGTLHAYLDGALDSLPAAQAEHVRRHLAECDICRARLDEERAVRDEAAAILGGASLDVGDLPSFEELRARAHAPRPATAGSRMQKLAWAATVVLALGTGWLLRGGIPRPTATVDALEDRADRGAASTGEPEGTRAGEVPAPPEDGAPVDAPTTAAAAAQESPTAKTVPGLDVRVAEAEVTDAAAGDTSSAPPLVEPADLWAAAQQRRNSERLGAQPVVMPPPAPSPTAAGTVSEPRVEQARRASNVTGAGLASRGAATDPAGPSLVVPGLTVISVTWLEEPALSGAVRVLQFMPEGDTLELVHLPAGVDPALLPPAAGGRTQFLAPRDGGWLVLRARASAEVLSNILRRLEGGD